MHQTYGFVEDILIARAGKWEGPLELTEACCAGSAPERGLAIRCYFYKKQVDLS